MQEGPYNISIIEEGPLEAFLFTTPHKDGSFLGVFWQKENLAYFVSRGVVDSPLAFLANFPPKKDQYLLALIFTLQSPVDKLITNLDVLTLARTLFSDSLFWEGFRLLEESCVNLEEYLHWRLNRAKVIVNLLQILATKNYVKAVVKSKEEFKGTNIIGSIKLIGYL